MSDNFRPLIALFRGEEREKTAVKEEPKKEDREKEFKAQIEKLLKEKKEAEDRAVLLEEELKKLRQENEALLKEIQDLKREIEARDQKLDQLLERIKNLEIKRELIDRLERDLTEAFESTKGELKNIFIDIAKETIKAFLLSDVVPKEEVVTRVLSEVFEKLVDIKGSVKINLNPKDKERVEEFLKEIRERFGDKIELEVISDESLAEGELKVETPKFVIERKNEEIYEEVFREAVKVALERS